MLKPGLLVPALLMLILGGCGGSAPPPRTASAAPATPENKPPAGPRQIRATGTIEAVRAFTVQVPRVEGQNNRMTLVRLTPNGTSVKEGDVLEAYEVQEVART